MGSHPKKLLCPCQNGCVCVTHTTHTKRETHHTHTHTHTLHDHDHIHSPHIPLSATGSIVVPNTPRDPSCTQFTSSILSAQSRPHTRSLSAQSPPVTSSRLSYHVRCLLLTQSRALGLSSIRSHPRVPCPTISPGHPTTSMVESNLRIQLRPSSASPTWSRPRSPYHSPNHAHTPISRTKASAASVSPPDHKHDLHLTHPISPNQSHSLISSSLKIRLVPAQHTLSLKC